MQNLALMGATLLFLVSCMIDNISSDLKTTKAIEACSQAVDRLSKSKVSYPNDSTAVIRYVGDEISVSLFPQIFGDRILEFWPLGGPGYNVSDRGNGRAVCKFGRRGAGQPYWLYVVYKPNGEEVRKFDERMMVSANFTPSGKCESADVDGILLAYRLQNGSWVNFARRSCLPPRLPTG